VTTAGRLPKRSWPVSAAIVVLVAACSAAPTTDRPLDEYRDLLRASWGESDQRALTIRAEEAVAACMADVGFEYYPDIPAAEVSVEFAPDDPEWVRQYGYGVTTRDEPEVPPDTEKDRLEGDVRNEDYRSALSEGASLAYYTALYGEGALPSSGGESPTEVSASGGAQRDAGCYDAGYRSVFPPMTTPEIDQILRELDIEMIAMADQPAMVALNAEWSECMARAGRVSLLSPLDARALVETAAAGAGAMTETEPGVFEIVVDEEAMQEARALELDLANEDLACRRATDYDVRTEDIVADIEEAFVDEHRQELDGWILWTESQIS
jgi:hypothetical protein